MSLEEGSVRSTESSTAGCQYPTVFFQFDENSAAVYIAQEHRARGPVGTAHHDNTGWQVWECSNVMLRFLLKKDLLKNESSLILDEKSRILDLSAGAGLISIALAASLGCRVVASDTTPQLPQLLRNVKRNKEVIKKSGGSVLVRSCYWGDKIEESGMKTIPFITPNTWLHEAEAINDNDDNSGVAVGGHTIEESATKYNFENDEKLVDDKEEEEDKEDNASSSLLFPWFDLCVVSDVLYIALRDGLAPQLRKSLRSLSSEGSCKAVLFAFEERLIREEEAFMAALGGFDAADGLTVNVVELESKYCTLEKHEALSNVGGLLREQTLAADIFWEPPPVRMFLFKQGGE